MERLGELGRGRAIMALVQRDGFQTIGRLAEYFRVTPQTIRRDVSPLCDQGLMRRRHGGVELPPVDSLPHRENLAYPTRQELHLAGKKRIARRLAQEVPPGAALFFGIGTTPEHCALALAGHVGLRVMTNNLNAALALCRAPSCEIVIAGGRLRPLDRDVVAGEAHDFFSHFSADIGIYGVGAVAPDGTLLDFSADEIRMREELTRHCRRRFLVLDHSKFSRSATVRGGHITDATDIFTDQPPPPAIAEMVREAGLRLVICGESPDPSEEKL